MPDGGCGIVAAVLVSVTIVWGQPPTEKGYKIINGVSLYYETIGDGTPIVVVHGGPGLDHSYLLPQMGELAKGYKLIFYDQRAMGKSSADFDTNLMTMNSFVEDLEGIRKAFGLEKMNLMGHSWGGLVSMFYAIRYPDTFTVADPRQYHACKLKVAEFVFCRYVLEDNERGQYRSVTDRRDGGI